MRLPSLPSFEVCSSTVTRWAASPYASGAAVVLILGWVLYGHLFGFSAPMQLFINTTTTIVTFLIGFLILHAQSREGLAVQVKLDELIRSSNARNDVAGVEQKTEAEIASLRKELEDP